MAVSKSDLENQVRLEVKGQGTRLAQQSFDDLFILRKSASNYYDMTNKMFNPLSSIWPANIFNAYIYINHVRSQGNKAFFWNVGKCFPHAGSVVVELD